MSYGFILRFRTQKDLNSVNELLELLKEKVNIFKLSKFFTSVNLSRRFTLVIECREQDIVEVMENYLSQFYSGDFEISILRGHESEIDKMMPI